MASSADIPSSMRTPFLTSNYHGWIGQYCSEMQAADAISRCHHFGSPLSEASKGWFTLKYLGNWKVMFKPQSWLTPRYSISVGNLEWYLYRELAETSSGDGGVSFYLNSREMSQRLPSIPYRSALLSPPSKVIPPRPASAQSYLSARPDQL